MLSCKYIRMLYANIQLDTHFDIDTRGSRVVYAKLVLFL